jgi:hypothetical protein
VRGDSPEDIGDLEVKLDWVVREAVENGIPVEEVKRKLEEHKEKAEKQSS